MKRFNTNIAAAVYLDFNLLLAVKNCDNLSIDKTGTNTMCFLWKWERGPVMEENALKKKIPKYKTFADVWYHCL